MGLVPFTPSKYYDVACLEDIGFDPKMKSLKWRTEKILKVGTQPPVTIVTEKTVVNNVEDNSKQLASMGITTTYANAHYVDKLTKNIYHYKGKMAEMKEFLRKGERVCKESKRKYEDTLSDYETLQQDYQILGEERDTLK